MAFAGARRVFGQDLLARVRRVASPAAVGVAADVAVRVADVVAVFFVEGVVGDEFEGLAPEDETVFEGEADAFEKEGVLEAAEVFEMRVFAEGGVEVLHAEGEVLG